MMVSTAMAVFQVCLSPMISSRWPLPMGTSPSTALRPVCMGYVTDLRGMIPGALISTLCLLLLLTGPRPSIGLPSASKTRPNISSPIGTSTMAPVLVTVSPSWIYLSFPKMTTPTLSVSRLSAMPLMPDLNSTISPAWTLLSPTTLAIPSPMLMTVPNSLTSF